MLLLAACRSAPLLGSETAVPNDANDVAALRTLALGDGAAPGDEEGPGSFVARGAARNYYAGAGGRLWYYMNNYYWAPRTDPKDERWIRAEVVEGFRSLCRWPDGKPTPETTPKITVEYWRVGPGGRSVRLDNHKDYCLLSDGYCAGAIEVTVTLAIGRVRVKDERERWGPPKEAYVLESRNYNDDRGIGADRTRFVPLAGEPVNVWSYRIPWSTKPDRMTRSRWLELEVPGWTLLERRKADPAMPAPVTAPDR